MANYRCGIIIYCNFNIINKKPALVKSIKRGAELILSKNGIIRSFENMGNKPLPYKMDKENRGK